MALLKNILYKCYYKVREPYRKYLYKKSGTIPKNRNLWVFGAWQGKMYADNSKYLFRYINANHPEICCVWVTNDKDVVKQVTAEGYVAYHIKTPKAKKIVMHAGVVFMTEGGYDIGGYLHKNALQIQLWHGMGIKNVKKFFTKFGTISQNDYASLSYAHQDDYWMTACNEAVMKYSDAYNIPTDRMFITGQPKDDAFINVRENVMIQSIRNEHSDCKVVVYLPTHRDFGKHGEGNMLSYDKLKAVNEMLAVKNTVMIFKPHFHEFKNYEGMNTNMSNIIFATDLNKYGDVYEFLPMCDALITDYSGIMLGYLTSGKPIIYFPYDKATYMSADAGFCYSYDEVTAGPICFTWEEVVDALSNIFINDQYKDEREKLRRRFSPYNDGKNSARVYHQVVELLERYEH
ncbi:MAG: hypothetical protein HFH94_07975 [Lachnospiraceae bacterium]|nr:CDP-glycerol glycerophosphotransferase family protein [uncultured Acetatifactor sp.]MCI9219659.1 hypothetical protein [Lachnospiraceae bacterium]